MATTTMMTMTTTTTTTTTMASNNNEAIRTVLANFNRESQRAKEYVAPQDQVLCEGYKQAMNKKFASVIKEMRLRERRSHYMLLSEIILII
jgi:hypothetical protein